MEDETKETRKGSGKRRPSRLGQYEYLLSTICGQAMKHVVIRIERFVTEWQSFLTSQIEIHTRQLSLSLCPVPHPTEATMLA